MLFHSTRGGDANKTFEEVLMQGLADDGGLFMPNEWPQVDLNELKKQKFMTKFMKSDLKPDYVLEKLNEINKTCIISTNNNGNKLFKLLANINLSQKPVLIKHNLNMETFNYINRKNNL